MDEIIELYYVDNTDNDTLKLCGVVKSLLNLVEKRIHENAIEVTGEFNTVLLNISNIDKLFMNGVKHAKSQKHPFVAIITDNENNAKTIISLIWLTYIGVSYSVDNTHVLQNVKWEAESIKSEKLDGSPFTLEDAIKYITAPRTLKNIDTQFSIESDGTNMGTKVCFNGEQIGRIQNIKFEINAEDHFGKVTMTVLNVPITLKIDESQVEKIIKDIE